MSELFKKVFDSVLDSNMTVLPSRLAAMITYWKDLPHPAQDRPQTELCWWPASHTREPQSSFLAYTSSTAFYFAHQAALEPISAYAS